LYSSPLTKFSQGDILEPVPHLFFDGPLSVAVGDRTTRSTGPIICTATSERAIILTPDCEIDKPKVRRWLICPVMPIETVAADNRQNVRDNKVFSRFYLPPYEDILSEGFADFNQISTISAGLLVTVNRTASLDEEGRSALYAQFMRWLTRWRLKAVRCPYCQKDIDLTATLPTRST
jgi:hypothetical protein